MTHYSNLSVEELKENLIIVREYLLQKKNLVDIKKTLATDKEQVVFQMKQNQDKSIVKLMFQTFNWIVLKPVNILGDIMIKIVDVFSNSKTEKNSFLYFIYRLSLVPLYIFVTFLILLLPGLLISGMMPQLGSMGIILVYIALIIGLYFLAKKYNDKKNERHDAFINQINQINDEISSVQMELNQINNANQMQRILSFIPERYFNLHAVESFLVYLFEGRAETWKELLNTYNQDVQFHTLNNKLDYQNETLEQYGQQMDSIKNVVWQQNVLLHNNFTDIRDRISIINNKLDAVGRGISSTSNRVDYLHHKVR